MDLTMDEVVSRLNDDLERTEEDLKECKDWLTEFQIENKMSLKELDDLCYEDSTWIFDQIFG
ncbi:MAG: hypothetical protein RR415_05700 [Ruthenibacterium sp.]